MRKHFLLGILVLVSAGSAARAGLSANLLVNPGAELGTGVDSGSTVTGWTVGGTSSPGRDDGTFDGFTPHSGSFDFYGGSDGNGTLTQIAPLSGLDTGTLALIDSGSETLNIDFFEQSLDQGGPNDAGQVVVSFQDAAHGALPGGYDSGLIAHTGGWQEVTGSAAVPSGARFMTYEMLFTLRNGVDVDSFIDDAGLTVPLASGVTGPGPGIPSAVPLPSALSSSLVLAAFALLWRLRQRGAQRPGA
jgi:hypothetical protein